MSLPNLRTDVDSIKICKAFDIRRTPALSTAFGLRSKVDINGDESINKLTDLVVVVNSKCKINFPP